MRPRIHPRVPISFCSSRLIGRDGRRVTAERLAQEVRAAAGDLLEELRIFDVYRGSGVDSGRKSVALGLILQETSRTLTDDDADVVVQAVISRLEHELEAKIRD